MRALTNLVQPDTRLGRSALALRAAWQLALWRPSDPEDAELKAAVSRGVGFTMISVARLRRLGRLVARALDQTDTAAIVECGSWRGGSAALLHWVAMRCGPSRPVFDSFQGLPPPGERDGLQARRAYSEHWCRASPGDVTQAFARLGAESEAYAVVPGWFEETLVATQTGPIAVLHVDADWYDSVRLCLETLHGRVRPGGLVVIDDYERWPVCTRAVDDFVSSAAPTPRLRRAAAEPGAHWWVGGGAHGAA